MPLHKFIDSIRKRLYWTKHIQRRDIQDMFGLGPSRAHDILTSLKELYGDRLKKVGHQYRLVEPDDADYSANEFMSELHAHYATPQNGRFYAKLGTPFIDPLIDRHIDNEVMRKVIQAIENKKALEILYVGMALGETAKKRIIEPIQLVYINERWHLHAFCPTESVSRDFVLSRIARVERLLPRQHAGLAQSVADMNALEEIKIAPHPDLTEDQAAIVRIEFRIKGAYRTRANA